MTNTKERNSKEFNLQKQSELDKKMIQLKIRTKTIEPKELMNVEFQDPYILNMGSVY